MSKYRMRADSSINSGVKEGTIVYDTRGYDYGCASDDTRETGYEHISVTLKEDGGYPFFTVPVTALEKLS